MTFVKKWEKGILFAVYLLVTISLSVAILLMHIPNHLVLNLLIPKFLILSHALFLLVLFVWKSDWIQRNRDWLAVLVLSSFLTLFTVFLYRNTAFSFSGIEDDLKFITASITKYANYWSWVDFSYKGLSAFYPPLYFYVLGKIAWLCDIEPYRIVRYGLFAEMLLLPPLVYLAWSKRVSSLFALFLTYGLLFFSYNLNMKPYEMLTLFLLLPWWWTYGEPLGGIPEDPRRRLRMILLGGFLGSLLFQTYYYWFFLLIVSFFVDFAFHCLQKKSLREWWKQKIHPFFVLVSTGFFSSLYIVPLLIDFLRYGVKPLQNRFLEAYMLDIPFYQLSFADPRPWVFLIGAFSLLFFWRRETVISRSLMLLVACYVWQWLGNLVIFFNNSLLHFKMHEMFRWLAVIGASYLLVRLVQHRRFAEHSRSLVAGILFGYLILFGQYFILVQNSQNFKEAMVAHVPREVSILKQVEVKDKVILTDKEKLQLFLPIFDFVSRQYAFSHPASRRDERIAFLQTLAKQKDPRFVAWLLRYNHYDPVDYVWLTNNRLSLVVDQFPNFTSKTITISFSPGIFQSPYFVRVRAGEDLFRVAHLKKQLFQEFTPEQKRIALKYAGLK